MCPLLSEINRRNHISIASKKLWKMWVYVDGACSANGKPWAKGGYGVWFGSNHHLNCSGTFYGRQTNQVAEIHAAIVAIEIATDEQADSLRIHTDSMYLINGATSWMDKWWRNNWLTCKGEPVVSKDKWIELEEAMNRFGGELYWKYVPGHRGNFGNDQADQLAKDAARSADNDDEDESDEYGDDSEGSYNDEYNDYRELDGFYDDEYSDYCEGF